MLSPLKCNQDTTGNGEWQLHDRGLLSCLGASKLVWGGEEDEWETNGVGNWEEMRVLRAREKGLSAATVLPISYCLPDLLGSIKVVPAKLLIQIQEDLSGKWRLAVGLCPCKIQHLIHWYSCSGRGELGLGCKCT